MMIALLSVGFVSCSSDDDDDTGSNSELMEKLQGTWVVDKAIMNIMGQTMEVGREELLSYMPSNTYAWDETLSFSGNKVNGVSYTLKGKQLLMEGMSIYDDIAIYIQSVSSNKLLLREVVKVEGYEFTIEIQYRKK